ncbi:MAG: hypothetical protein K0S37_804 [Microbacterium sp.]|nr:hypothetical protein [Microbacterium sp.]
MSAWNYTPDYRTQWTPTADPRIVAVIETQDDPSAPYGDALCPAYSLEYAYAYSVAQVGDTFADAASADIANAYARARTHAAHGDARRDAHAFAARYLRVFHDSRVLELDTRGNGGGDRVILLDTPTYRAHVGRDTHPTGATIHRTWTDAELFAGEAAEWRAYMSGDVFGVGYAVLSERVTEETPVPDDLSGWDVTIECWGFYGETHARESAAEMEHGAPVLPELLAL